MKYQNSISKIKNFAVCFIILIFVFCFLILKSTKAISMESSSFKLESAGVHDAAGKKSSDSYQLSDTIGQLAAGEFASSGYVIKAGFQYLYSLIPFRFSISNTKINFGTVIPNTFFTETTTLTVSFGSGGQYQVTAQEIGPMTSLTGANTIPDTSCNGGSQTCNESLAKIWNSTSAYGFGYNMSGDDIPSDFIDSSYFRPFPDRLASENPAVVMSSTNIGKNRQATMTLKLNISPVQPAGTYQTVINFVATPSY